MPRLSWNVGPLCYSEINYAAKNFRLTVFFEGRHAFGSETWGAKRWGCKRMRHCGKAGSDGQVVVLGGPIGGGLAKYCDVQDQYHAVFFTRLALQSAPGKKEESC